MSVPEAIRAAYDSERFRADGHRLIDGRFYVVGTQPGGYDLRSTLMNPLTEASDLDEHLRAITNGLTPCRS